MLSHFNAAKAAAWAFSNYATFPKGVPPWRMMTGTAGWSDCTNFVSQALYVGGWKMVLPFQTTQTPEDIYQDPNATKSPDNGDSRKKYQYWYVDPYLIKTGHVHAFGRTWTASDYLVRFAVEQSKRGACVYQGAGISLDVILRLQPGDVLHIADKTLSQGIDHLQHTAMVVAAAWSGIRGRASSSLPQEHKNNVVVFPSPYGVLAQHSTPSLHPLTRWLKFTQNYIYIWRPLPRFSE